MIKLYSDAHCPNSHRTRIVLAEKELPVTTQEVETDNLPADFLKLNPYGKLPTVIDRDIVFFESSVVNEYLDERYPHPPLKPGSPAERAQMRLAVLQLERELYPLYEETSNPRKKKDAVKKISAYLESLNGYLARQEYFIGEQYTLADITLAPILWRLESLDIDTAAWPHLEGYMDRLFERPAFERALSEVEQMLREY
ncbi:glutathione S-transferase family protein [Mariprofundus ferrooxydans]|uniref:Stringent starvation protein A n=1 Tax=Mariprofundus ferrooxydans PV-1 TaxID=314345 RepID=Q0F2B8_9PROT|nr:glutathione binding-like protein [Mariprofundus ferrooxydans]EAU55632.1 stringent starvation protein A [Mariprofundus ferrooxydans PV-1]KON48637.1 stringent starvation protein A [Mariprofundus ferrooxydans]